MKFYKLTPPFSNLSPLFRSFLSFSHLLYMKMYTGRMASAVGTKRDSSSEDWRSISATIQNTCSNNEPRQLRSAQVQLQRHRRSSHDRATMYKMSQSYPPKLDSDTNTRHPRTCIPTLVSFIFPLSIQPLLTARY